VFSLLRLIVFFLHVLLNLDRVLDLREGKVVLAVSVFSQLVILHSQLLKKPKVGLNLSAVPHVLESLGGAVVFLDHEVGGGDCGAAAVAHVAADEDKPAAHAESSLDEVRRLLKEVGDWRGGQVLADKPLVTDSLLGKFGWVHPHILFSAVDNVGYPKVQHVVKIFDAFPIANNDPGKHFVTILSVLHPRFLVHVSWYARHEAGGRGVRPQSSRQVFA